MTRTLRRERIQKFEAIIIQWLSTTPALPQFTIAANALDSEVKKLAELLADAAASRTEAEKPSLSIGADQLSWDLYNAIKETKYMGVKVRTKLRDVLEEKIGKEDKMRNKEWDDWHGFPEELKVIVTRLEKFLNLRNMMRDERAVEVYQWVADQEKAGKMIAKFADWALQPERAQFVGKYKKTPEAIKTDWQLAFSSTETKKGGYDEVRF